jgi:hypothetical protein
MQFSGTKECTILDKIFISAVSCEPTARQHASFKPAPGLRLEEPVRP